MLSFGEIVNGLPGIFMCSYFIVILIAQTALCVNAFLDGRRTGYKALCLLHVILSFILFTLVMDGTFRAEYLGYPRSYPAAVIFVYSLPWWTLAAYEAIETVVLIWLSVIARRRADNVVSYTSIKEAVDLLPDGMGWYTGEGTPVLLNERLAALSNVLTGDPLTNSEQLWITAQEHSHSENQPLMLSIIDSGTILMRRETKEQNGQCFIHISAEDITEQYHLTGELREKNKALTELQKRYIEYSRSMVRLETEKSVIAARADIHSELGHALLLAKAYLSGTANDPEALLTALKEINQRIIDNKNVDQKDIRPCEAAIRKAERIGVAVQIDGMIPKDESIQIILARAIDECSTNAAKHAGATLITVKIEPASNGIEAIIAHNGESPSKNQTETGGLMLLRYEIESAGGTMKTLSDPAHSIFITLPVEG